MKRFLLAAMLLITCAAYSQTTYYISNSITASDNNSGTDTAHSWKTVKSFTAGNTYLFRRGSDTFYVKIPKLTTTTVSKRVKIGAYGIGISPVLSAFSTIKPSAWTLYATNIWRANITTATNVTGFVTGIANTGMIVADNVKYGKRAGKITGLVSQWQFYCNFGTSPGYIYVYSTAKPSTLADIIKISSDENQIKVSKYMTIESVQIIGCAAAPLLIEQPVNDTIRYCHLKYNGGEMKSASDTTRQGAGIAFYNGGTNSMEYYDTVESSYECAFTFQTHNSGAVPGPYTNCIIRKCYTDSCESSFNPSVAVVGAPGFIGCRVDSNYFSYDGYGWSHDAKPVDNQSISLLNNFSDWNPTQTDLIIENNTIYNPREGLYFVSGPDVTIPFTSRKNDITMAAGGYIRKNYPGTTKWTWKIEDSAAFVKETGSEIRSHFHVLGVSAASTSTYYRDADGDGFGNESIDSVAASQPTGYVSNSGDCNDANANIHPGAIEMCDGLDNNCDGNIDETCMVFYHDADRDSYGNLTDTLIRHNPPADYISRAGDCNDADSTIYPGAPELCDGKDNDCNGLTDEKCDTSVVSFADTASYGYEQKGNIKITLKLSKALANTEYITYSTIDGTAIGGIDFVGQNAVQIIIPAGSTSVNFSIPLIKDKSAEATKYFKIKLSDATSATIVNNTTFCYVIDAH
jgi:hypothetical protein